MTTLVNDEIIRVFEPRLKTCFLNITAWLYFRCNYFLTLQTPKLYMLENCSLKCSSAIAIGKWLMLQWKTQMIQAFPLLLSQPLSRFDSFGVNNQRSRVLRIVLWAFRWFPSGVCYFIFIQKKRKKSPTIRVSCAIINKSTYVCRRAANEIGLISGGLREVEGVGKCTCGHSLGVKRFAINKQQQLRKQFAAIATYWMQLQFESLAASPE